MFVQRVLIEIIVAFMKDSTVPSASFHELNADPDLIASRSEPALAMSDAEIEPSFAEDVAEETSEAVDAPAEPACEKCHTRLVGKQGWCRRCGWYPRLATFVELDPWDRVDAPTAEAPAKFELFKHLGPPWAWKLAGGAVLILALSLGLRFALPQQGGIRFVWTVGQMLIGSVVFYSAHLSCYLFAITFNDRLSLLDIVLKPLVIWGTVLREMPSTFWRVALGTWGTAAVWGALLIGGLADKDLLDWGGKPARYNLTKAIADRARQLAADAENNKSLEESVQDFAGQAGDPDAKADERDAKNPKLPVDCLIIGYKPLGDRDFYALILAADFGGKLVVVGTVTDGITPKVRAELNERMRPLRQPNPFIPCKLDGKWIRPELVCRIKAKRWSDDHRLIEPVFDEMLVDVDIQP
jgi:hypothetical protein